MSRKQPGGDVLGRQLRAMRHERGLRLVDLGAATGLSHAFLSQIECGSAYPSLSTLWTIAEALGVEPGVLLHEATRHEPLVVRGGEGRVVVDTEDERGAVVRARTGMHHLQATIAEGRLDTPRLDSHSGEEFVYILEGALTIVLGDTEHLLAKGDSIVFDGSVPHGYSSAGEGDAQVLFVFTMHGAKDTCADRCEREWFQRLRPTSTDRLAAS